MKFIIRLTEDIYVETEADSLNSARQKALKLKEEAGDDISKKIMEVKIKPQKMVKGLYGHLVQLKEEGYFKEPRTLTDIREKLKEFAVHYPSTTFPPYLSRLLQERLLRRFKDNKKSAWVYVNY